MANNVRTVARKTGRALFGVAGVSGFTDDLKAQWQQAIADFQSQRAQLDSAESALYEVYPQVSASEDPEDLAEWQRTFNKVNAAKSSMDAVASLVQSASDMWGSFTGLFGLNGVGSKMRRRGMVNALAGNLGIAPVLPFGLTLGGLFALTTAAVAAINATYAFISWWNAKHTYQQQLVDQGVAPERAAEIASQQASQESGYSTGARIQNIALIAGAAAVAVAFFSRHK